jgi:hypothetical protein
LPLIKAVVFDDPEAMGLPTKSPAASAFPSNRGFGVMTIELAI